MESNLDLVFVAGISKIYGIASRITRPKDLRVRCLVGLAKNWRNSPSKGVTVRQSDERHGRFLEVGDDGHRPRRLDEPRRILVPQGEFVVSKDEPNTIEMCFAGIREKLQRAGGFRGNDL